MLSKWLNERENTDIKEIDRLLGSSNVCRVAFRGGEFPTIVPMCFGHDISGGEMVLYIRCGESVKISELLKTDNRVAFEIDEPVRMKHEENGGGFSIPVFKSVTGTGIIEVISGIEKLTGLGFIIKKFGDAPEHNKIPELYLNALIILKMTVTEFCCTEHNSE